MQQRKEQECIFLEEIRKMTQGYAFSLHATLFIIAYINHISNHRITNI